MPVLRVPRVESLEELARTPGLGWAPWIGKKPWLQCPNGHRTAYGFDKDGHTISADGLVTPSTVCPEESCDFHEFVLLEGWVAMDDVVP